MNANLKESELPEMLRTNHREAFKLLYRNHYRMVEYFVTKNSGSASDAEDIFQEVMIALFNNSRDKDFKLTCSIKTYIYSIGRNLWLKQLRKQSRETRVTDYEKFESINAEEEDPEEPLTVHVTAALEQLGESCRKILLLFYYHKKTMEEIAASLGYTNAANAKNQKYKCLQHLKNKLTNANA